MALVAVDSLSLKIQSFLRSAGVKYDDSSCSQTQLLRYFEEEFGLEMMPLLEQEWIDEQLTRDLTSGDFWQVRDRVEEGQLENFDRAVSAIWSS